MKTKVLVSLCLFFMPMFMLGCGGGGTPASQQPPSDVKDIVAKQKKMYDNMKKAKDKPVR